MNVWVPLYKDNLFIKQRATDRKWERYSKKARKDGIGRRKFSKTQDFLYKFNLFCKAFCLWPYYLREKKNVENCRGDDRNEQYSKYWPNHSFEIIENSFLCE